MSAEPLSKEEWEDIAEGFRRTDVHPSLQRMAATIDAYGRLLASIHHQAVERLEDGHSYKMMLTATVIRIEVILYGGYGA